VFFSNYQNYPGMQDQQDVQVRVKHLGGTETIPDQPFTLQKGAYFFWPFNLDLDGIRLRYATAQPVCRLPQGDAVTAYYFKACQGVPADYAFADGVTRAEPNLELPMVRTEGGRTVRIFTVTEEQADNLWKINVAGRERLIYSENGLYEENGKIVFYGETPVFNYAVRESGGWTWRKTSVPAQEVRTRVEPYDGPVTDSYDHYLFVGRGGQGEAPSWKVTLPDGLPDGVQEVLLRVRFTGDVLHAMIGEELIYDEFYQGLPVDIGLRRHSRRLQDGLILRISPLRRDQDIYLDQWPEFTRGEMAQLHGVGAVPIYRASVVMDP
jgi:hypothetical protein